MLNELKIPLKDVFTLFIFVGGLFTSWVNLNNNQTEMMVRQEETFKYYERRILELEGKIKNIETTATQTKIEAESKIKEIEGSYQDLDRTITKLYQDIIKKK
jgi:hypothetical protein